MYNNTNNNMNPLFSLLGLTGGGQGAGGGQSGQGGQGGSQSQGGGMDQSNPLMQLLAAMMSGQNAMNALQHIMPQAAQYAQNNRGGQNMEQFVRNEYANRGVDINGAMEQLQQLMNTMNGYGGSNPGSNQNTGANNNTNNTF
jgi:hypothetical protein